ncbi:MAG: hypothetical protein HRT57_08720 [Crocinitomicaceae bacterium]|nr:hypothetical protein [Crocinitomicaceae bacterium]
MKLGIFLSIYLTATICIAQTGSSNVSSRPDNKSKLGGLVAYYIWEEDSLGKIVKGSLMKPYQINDIVVLNSAIKPKKKITRKRMKLAISGMYHNNARKAKRSFKTHPKKNETDRVYVPLRKKQATELSTVQYTFKAGSWESSPRKRVLYFNVYQDSSKNYSHSNDSIILKYFDVKRKAESHYMVKTFWDTDNHIVDQQVYAYNGQNITSYCLSTKVEVAQRVLIFSNGYRGPKRNKDITDNLITKKDRYWYWRKLDKLFISRMKPDNFYYIDGNHSINTSTHRNKANFVNSYARIKALKKKPEKAGEYQLLNTKSNMEGFQLRKETGAIAAQAYLSIRCTLPGCNEVKDTMDLVCHSMGYAYALGFLEALRDKVVFGKIYIIAAENACADGMNWTEFEEVWQYGSNLGQKDADPVWEQDGVAPQCEVKNIDSAKIGGRVFLLSYIRKKEFLNSHMLKQYQWIIKKLEPSDPGYVN